MALGTARCRSAIKLRRSILVDQVELARELEQVALYVSAAKRSLLQVATERLVCIASFASTSGRHNAVAFGARLVTGSAHPGPSYA